MKNEHLINTHGESHFKSYDENPNLDKFVLDVYYMKSARLLSIKTIKTEKGNSKIDILNSLYKTEDIDTSSDSLFVKDILPYLRHLVEDFNKKSKLYTLSLTDSELSTSVIKSLESSIDITD